MSENDDDFLNLKTIPVRESYADSLPLTINNTGKRVQSIHGVMVNTDRQIC